VGTAPEAGVVILLVLLFFRAIVAIPRKTVVLPVHETSFWEIESAALRFTIVYSAVSRHLRDPVASGLALRSRCRGDSQ
jgi:hypothetical protein